MDESQPEVKSSKDRLRLLVNNEFFSDMTVLVGPAKTPVYVNKAILGIASPYFEKLLYGPLGTTSLHTNLPDTEPEVFKLFLDYIYTDQLDEKLDGDLVWKLLDLAKMCLVPHLETTCRQNIVRNFNVNNVLGDLAQSEWNDEREIGKAAERFIDWSMVEFLETQEFLNLDLDLLCKLFGRDTLEIRESVLYDSLVRWSDAECGRQGFEPTTENKRKVLGRSLELIRVSRMTDEEIAASLFDGIFPDSGPPPPKSQKRSVIREFAPEKYYIKRFAGFSEISVEFPLALETFETCIAELRGVDLTIGIVSDRQIFLHGVGVFCDFKKNLDDHPDDSSQESDLSDDEFWGVNTYLKVKVFDMCKNSSEPQREARRSRVVRGDEFMDDFIFSRGPLLIRPGVKYDIHLEGQIDIYGDDLTYEDRFTEVAEGKKGVSPFSEVTVGPTYNGNHATVKIESPKTPRKMSDAIEFSLGNMPELIFSF